MEAEVGETQKSTTNRKNNFRDVRRGSDKLRDLVRGDLHENAELRNE